MHVFTHMAYNKHSSNYKLLKAWYHTSRSECPASTHGVSSSKPCFSSSILGLCSSLGQMEPPTSRYTQGKLWQCNFQGYRKSWPGNCENCDSQLVGTGHCFLFELVHLPYSSDIVEALAVARAISFALELGSSPFILEGDSEIVIKDLISTDVSFSPCGHILTSAKAITEPSSCASFFHVLRLGNSVAHNLTKYARHVRGFLVWMEDVSPHLQSLLSTNYG